MSQWKWPIVVLLIAVLATVALRGVILRSKTTYLQDEGASLLLITGHMPAYDSIMYDGAYPARVWAPAAAWKEFITPRWPLSFRYFSIGVAVTDFHPPLFYWLLYQWYRVFGVDPWTGSWFCVLIAALGAAALFGFGAEALDDRMEAAAAVLIWAVSPAVIVCSDQARQYDLLALFTVLMCWRTLHVSDPARPLKKRELAWLVLISGAGMLTHYHFALVLSGCMAYGFFKLARIDVRRMAAVLAAMMVGAAGLIVFHPGFYHSFQRGLNKERGFEIMEQGLDKASGFHVMEALGRSLYAVKSLGGFFVDGGAVNRLVPGGSAAAWGALFILLALGLILPRLLKAPARDPGTDRGPGRSGGAIWFFLAWIGGWTVVLYVSCISPSQAMGTRYLAAVWPFFAFLPVLFFRRFGSRKKIITAAFCAFLMVSGGLTAAARHAQGAGKGELESERFDELLLDSLSRTQAPSVIYLVPDRVRVFAAYQDYLLAHPEAWVDGLRGRVVYISRYGFGGNSPEKTRQVLELIRSRRRVVSVSSFGPGAFVIEVGGP